MYFDRMGQVKYFDSNGNRIDVGDKVTFNGKVYTIRAFGGKTDGRMADIEFMEGYKGKEIPNELTVTLLTEETDVE